jgi:hypothetical protein
MNQQRYAIFTGSLGTGFSIYGIATSSEAAYAATTRLRNDGHYGESISIQPPSTLTGLTGDDIIDGGDYVLIRSDEIDTGITIYGPFNGWDEAYKFAHGNRGRENWEHLVCGIVVLNDGSICSEVDLKALTIDPRIFIEELDYDIDTDSDQPGFWIWTAPSDGCDISFQTPKAALDDAWLNAVTQTLRIKGIDRQVWDTMPFVAQKYAITSALSGEDDDIQAVVDDVIARAKKHGFTPDESTAWQCIADSANLLGVSIEQTDTTITQRLLDAYKEATEEQDDEQSFRIKVSLDGGESFQDAKEGVRIVYEGVPIPGEDGTGELHFNATHEGLVTDIWTNREEPLDHNIGTSSQLVEDIVGDLVTENE